MDENVFQILDGGSIASIVWFAAGGLLYMNPLVAGFYRRAEGSPASRKWSSTPGFLGITYLGILVQCLLWAFVFVWIRGALDGGCLAQGLALVA